MRGIKESELVNADMDHHAICGNFQAYACVPSGKTLDIFLL